MLASAWPAAKTTRARPNCPAPESARRRVADRSPERERGAARRVDELDPDEESGREEEGVLGRVQGRARERGVVHGRDVPDTEHGEPEHERGYRPDSGHDPPEPRRHDEEEERSAQREDEQQRHEVADDDVLEHVRREQLLLGDSVERREEGEQPEHDREAEEHRPPPPGEVGATAPAQAPEAPRKAHDGHPGSREHRRVEAPARVRYETAQRTPR